MIITSIDDITETKSINVLFRSIAVDNITDNFVTLSNIVYNFAIPFSEKTSTVNLEQSPNLIFSVIKS